MVYLSRYASQAPSLYQLQPIRPRLSNRRRKLAESMSRRCSSSARTFSPRSYYGAYGEKVRKGAMVSPTWPLQATTKVEGGSGLEGFEVP